MVQQLKKATKKQASVAGTGAGYIFQVMIAEKVVLCFWKVAGNASLHCRVGAGCGLPARFCFHHAAGDVKLFQVFPGQDDRVIGGVERL